MIELAPETLMTPDNQLNLPIMRAITVGEWDSFAMLLVALKD